MEKEAMFYEKLDFGKVCCHLCAHHCLILPSQSGFCGVRKNTDGRLNTLVYAEAVAANVDPIEKKPLYHFLPGTTSYSIATRGCNLKCGFCQNWQISQNKENVGRRLMPDEVVEAAISSGTKSISYTYTEPTVFFEYAYDIAKLAKKKGLYNIFVTNGYMSKEAIVAIRPYLDAANVDLKSFNDDFYLRNCQGRLKPVLDSIKVMKELGVWVEVTTLVIPGQNDSQEELKSIAQFIAAINKNIPWHISQFHPDYEFLDYKSTSLDILEKAYKQGRSQGLRYVYLGNIKEGADTYCPECNKLLLKRNYFNITENNLQKNKCSFCQETLDGFF